MNLRIFAPGNIRGAAPPQSVTANGTYTPAAVDPHAEQMLADQPGRAYLVAQRATDLLISAAVLLVMFPLFLIIALLIKRESPGPVLFRQKRVGKDGNTFWFYKFRSMVADAEAKRNALMQMNEASGPLFKIKNDPRVTKVGRFIRKWSLDEFPQLINVITGEMSIVGPRPALPCEVAQYTPRQRVRLSVKPGITGLWQVSGRSDLPFERSIELDLEYIAQQSYRMYVRILIMTIPAVLKGKGAY